MKCTKKNRAWEPFQAVYMSVRGLVARIWRLKMCRSSFSVRCGPVLVSFFVRVAITFFLSGTTWTTWVDNIRLGFPFLVFCAPGQGGMRRMDEFLHLNTNCFFISFVFFVRD